MSAWRDRGSGAAAANRTLTLEEGEAAAWPEDPPKEMVEGGASAQALFLHHFHQSYRRARHKVAKERREREERGPEAEAAWLATRKKAKFFGEDDF